MTLTCTNVTLRQKALRNDRISLYLDYYPAIRNPYTMKMSRREFLGIYLYAKPRNEQQRMGEDNVLMNRHLHIKATELLDGVTPTSTPTSTPASVIPESENVKRLISAIAEKHLSVKEIMAAVGLKDRPNFIEYSLSPAMREGYVRMLYPDSPRHPRQKYLLTVKGLAAYKELSR